MKKTLLILCALLFTAWGGVRAQITDGSYMVVNTETSQFLYGSYDWGARASLGSKPVFWTVTSVGNNTYTLANPQWTDTHYLYLTGDLQYYCDGSSTADINLTIVSDGDGYTISDSGNYMYAQAGKNAVVTSTTDASLASHWQFVSLKDVINSMEGASSANPVDVTALIDDANFKPGGNNLTATNNWTNSSSYVTIGSYDGTNHITVACCAEAYEKESYNVSQTITLPKAGYYNLSAQGFYRNGGDGTGTNSITAQMFAGDQTVDLNARQTTANTMADAWAVFLAGSEPVPSITYHATSTSEEGEQVAIGFSGSLPSNSGCWAIFGELQLEYLGETLEYAIGEPECTTEYVQPGGKLSITFPDCVTPDTDEEPVLSTTAGSITVNGTAVTDAVLTSTGLTSTVTFTVPTTIAQGAEVTVVVPAGLVYWEGSTTTGTISSPVQDVTFTLSTPAIADQMGVYLMNCNTEEYLSRGYNWGTRADVDYYGIPVDIVSDEDGLYTIQYVDNSGYLGDTGWAYGDCGTDRWVHYTIESYSDDGVTGYRFKCVEASTEEVSRYLYLNENNSENDEVNEPLVANNGLLNDNYEVESQAVWQIHDETAHTAQKAAFVASQKAAIAALVDATDLDEYIATKVVNDVTALVEDPGFASATSPANATETSTGWVGSYPHTENGNDGNFSSGSNGFESWNGCMQLQQTITDLPSGVYKIDLEGFFRQATNIICYSYKDYDMSTAFIDANGYEINLKPWASEASLNSGATGTQASDYAPNSKDASYTACVTGYANELYTYVGDDGTLVITIDNQGYAFDEWMYLRGMALTYYGDEVVDDSEYKTGDEVAVTVDGEEITYTVVSDNMFVNGGFNNGMIGWTAGGYTTDAFPSDFNVQSEGGFNEGKYLIASSGATTSEKTPSQAVAVTSGKTYLFIGYTTGSVPTTGNDLYSSLFKMSDATTEVSEENQPVPYVTLEWGAATGSTATTWTKTMAVFTADTDYAGVRLGWSTGSYDGFQLYEVTTKETIEWEMTDAGWGTLILPFDAAVPDGLTAYSGEVIELGEEDSDGNTALTIGDASTSIIANTPYLVRGTEGTYTFSGTSEEATNGLTAGYLTGTLVDMDYTVLSAVSSTVYLLQKHTEEDSDYQEGEGLGVAFYPVTEDSAPNEDTGSEGASLTAYHCYLTLSDAAPAKLSIGFIGGEETGIVAVEGDVIADDAIYDLSGRRVSKAVKGVYIMNGKKVLVK